MDERAELKQKIIQEQIDALSDAYASMLDVSIQYKELSDGAKTRPKRKLYYKKLVKNNKEVANVLVKLNRLYNIQNKQQEEVSDDKIGNERADSTTSSEL